MPRLNLTLDAATFTALGRAAKKRRRRVASHARLLLRDALGRVEAAERWRGWADAYRADRKDATKLLADFEPAALELLGDEDT